MPPTEFNLQNLRARQFKGFAQMSVDGGTTYFRLKGRQTLNVNLNFTKAPHYADDGQKELDPSGHNHTFNLTTLNTSDFYDPTFAGTADDKTLTDMIYKASAFGANIADLENVRIIFVSTQEALSGPAGFTTQKFIHWKFTLDAQTFSTSFGASGGYNPLTIAGEIISIQSVVRSASADAP